MITHVVLFKPRASLTTEQRRTILDNVAESIKQIPSVRRCRLGQRVRHGLPGYEQAMHENYEFVLMLEFDDIEGLRAYLGDQHHRQLGEFFTSAAAASLAYDYDVMDLAASGSP
jgi:Stress responsive A/B Barrel Domain